MNSQITYDRCLSFINSHLQNSSRSRFAGVIPRRAVTISRLTGAGAHQVAQALVAQLEELSPGNGCSWTVFDRNLVEKVLADHNLPARLARFMPEDRIPQLADLMDELFGLHPQSEVLVRKISETILHLAEIGNVVIIGRGGNLITASLKHVLHVRLVASLAHRLAYVRKEYQLEPAAARQFVEKEDLGRARYVKTYFGKNIDDPQLYDLTINTDHIAYSDAALLICEALKSKTAVAHDTSPVLVGA
jgi:cytidylate kinase